MGLKNASQQFQQMMEDRLGPARNVADPFIDDILVGTRVEPGEDLLAAHERDVRRVMKILKRAQFMCDKRKCHFFVDEVEFLWTCAGGTRRPAPGKLACIKKWEQPQTISEMRAFFGFHKLLQFIHLKICGNSGIPPGQTKGTTGRR